MLLYIVCGIEAVLLSVLFVVVWKHGYSSGIIDEIRRCRAAREKAGLL